MKDITNNINELQKLYRHKKQKNYVSEFTPSVVAGCLNFFGIGQEFQYLRSFAPHE